MSLSPINDNQNLRAPKALDDREGVFQSGVFRAYLNKEEANTKTANRRYPNMVVPITIDVDGTPVDVSHRWNGTDWVIDDAIQANNAAETKIPLAQKNAVGGVPSIDTISLNNTIDGLRSLNGVLKSPVIYTTDKNKESVWILDPTDTSTPDDGYTTIVTSDGKRFKSPRRNVVEAWRFGIKGDGITDDTASFQNMLQIIPSNTTIDFGDLNVVFDSVNLVGKRNIKFQGNGSIFKGTVIIGDIDPLASVYDANFSAIGIRFEHTGWVRNCFEVANVRGIYISEIYCNGSNSLFYVRPINKFQHFARGYVKNCHGNSNYLVYCDNTINTAPYTNILMSTGDIEVSGNADHQARICNFLGFGVDGAVIANNIFFMTSYHLLSQIKNQNVRIVAGNWISVVNNQMFEAGLEGILLELNRNFTISDNRFAWSGQRDVNLGYGIRVTGGGYTQADYSTGVISDNLFDGVTRTNIKLDALTTGVSVDNNRGVSTGSALHYYGNGLNGFNNPSVVPALNSVTGYHVEADINTRRCSATNNTDERYDCFFPFSETSGISNNEQLKHYNNSCTFKSGYLENRPATVPSISSDGKVFVNISKNLVITTGSTISVIKDILGAIIGDSVIISNQSSSQLSIENNDNIQLATAVTYQIPSNNAITLQKRVDKWYEISRTDNGAPKSSLYINGASGTNRDFGFQTSGSLRWILRTNNTPESTGNIGSDLEVIARNDDGSFAGTVAKFFRSTLNVVIGSITNTPSAIFSLNSTNKGFLPPRMTISQRDLIASPAIGLTIYNIDSQRNETFNGASWEGIDTRQSTIYNPTNGVLITTSILGSSLQFLTVKVTGNTNSVSGRKTMDSLFQARNNSGTIDNTGGISNGYPLRMDMFIYNGFVCAYLPFIANFLTYNINVLSPQGTNRGNLITSIQDAVKPVSGVTSDVTIVSDAVPPIIKTPNTTDVVTASFLNTNYPVSQYPIDTVIKYYNQGMTYTRITDTIWDFTPTNILS